jgi:nucleoside-triphosphatase
METVEGKRGVLAHEDFKSGPRVSRYRVDVPAFERLAVAEIERALASAEGVLVVDEIGKMELFSDAFTRAIAAAFDSPLRVLATIMQKPHPFADGIKARKDVALTIVTPANRDALAEELASRLAD